MTTSPKAVTRDEMLDEHQKAIAHIDRDLISKYGPGGEAEAPTCSLGKATPEVADSPGPTMTDDEAFEELVGSRFQLEAFMGSVDKGSRAAIAHLRSRLAPKKVSREWVNKWARALAFEERGFDDMVHSMLRELGIVVEDK